MDYCPFPRPAVARARRLVRASGTAGMRVEVQTFSELDRALRSLGPTLRRIGYRASVRLVDPPERYFARVDRADGGVQAGAYTWFSDYPAASNYFELLRCRAGNGSPPSNFCDRSIEALLTRARARQIAVPATADALWARADRAVVDAAPWVPLFNPDRLQAGRQLPVERAVRRGSRSVRGADTNQSSISAKEQAKLGGPDLGVAAGR